MGHLNGSQDDRLFVFDDHLRVVLNWRFIGLIPAR